MPKYLQCELRLVTTQCIIVEADNLGPHLVGATQIVKKFLVHRCGHDKQSISGQNCIKSMVKSNNYIVATQDRELQEWLRQKPGQPLMYLHKKTPVLERPSPASKKIFDKKVDEAVNLNDTDVEKLKTMKTREGVQVETVILKKKKHKKKQPNPLSCKKKQKKSNSGKINVERGFVAKKARQRIKIPKHVKDHLKNKS